MVIRKGTHSDLLLVSEIHIKAWRFAYDNIMEARVLDNLNVKDRIRAWESVLDNYQGELFVANKDKTIIGFIHLSSVRDTDLDSKLFGEITAIYIEPEYIGKGVGYRLLLEAISHLKTKGHAKVFLWVLKNNILAKQFYIRNGVVSNGKEKIHPDKSLVE
ncbi:MAG: GNAT family N-acetyltransferase [Methylococcales bacterium]|nr:GNAT family N-acetyltransferase [Methylococcales bacterium]